MSDPVDHETARHDVGDKRLGRGIEFPRESSESDLAAMVSTLIETADTQLSLCLGECQRQADKYHQLQCLISLIQTLRAFETGLKRQRHPRPKVDRDRLRELFGRVQKGSTGPANDNQPTAHDHQHTSDPAPGDDRPQPAR